VTHLKICGIRDISHAVTAADGGADYLGFNFVPGVRRRLEEDHARDMISQFRSLQRPNTPKLVGLFADQPVDEVNRILNECDLDVAQLCGSETPDYWQKVERPVIRQLKVSGIGPVNQVIEQVCQAVEQVVSLGHNCMLDRYVEGEKGGTGHAFDWDIARGVAQRHPFILAGGLTPSSVSEAIQKVHPWGVDVSSGVETDGVKDLEKITTFCQAVRQASIEIKEQ